MKRAWVGIAVLVPMLASAQGGTFTTKSLTPETELKAAQAALLKCRAEGTQVVLRDRFAGPHTVEIAANKAWTAVSFRTNTDALDKASRAEGTMSGLRQFPRVVTVGGGLMIEGGGSLFGGIGVSGAPGGDNDAACAAVGIKAIAEDLEF